jgi:hypothetical protein
LEEKQVQTLTEIYTEYINYLNRTEEEITFEEWRTASGGKLRKYEPAIEKYIKYGLVAILGLGILSKLTVGQYAIYRRNSDYCIQRCGGKKGKPVTSKCYNTCYAQASLAVVNRIKSDMSVTNKIEDSEKRRKVEEKLRKELEKWQDRYEKHKLRAETAAQVIAGPRSAGEYKKRGKK